MKSLRRLRNMSHIYIKPISTHSVGGVPTSVEFFVTVIGQYLGYFQIRK